MDELRWILLGLGTLIVVGVYGYSRLQDWRTQGLPWRRRASQREPFADDKDPVLDDEDPILGSVTVRDDSQMDPAKPIDSVDSVDSIDSVAEPVLEPELDLAPVTDAEPAADLSVAVGDEEKVVALSVMAPSGRPYPGNDLRDALLSAGLKFAEPGVFRRSLDTHNGTIALFTVANIVEPGVFARETSEGETFSGVVFIMQLPGPFDGLSTFEQMLTTAQRLAEQLGGQVLDGRRCDLTTQSIEHIREELVEYRRRAKLASRREG